MVALASVILATGQLLVTAQPTQQSAFVGRWDLTLATASGPRPSWLEIQSSGPRTLVGRFVGIVGSARPISRVDVTGDTFSFSIPPQFERGDKDLHVEGKVDGDHLAGWLTEPSGTRVTWTGNRAPSLRRTSPVEWGDPVEIFNGRDTSGWHPQQGASQWVVIDHTLTSPKSGANLVSDRMFTDFTAAHRVPLPEGLEQRHLPARPLRGADRRQRGSRERDRSPRRDFRLPRAERRCREESRRLAGLRHRPYRPEVTVILNGTTIIANQRDSRHHRRRDRQQRGGARADHAARGSRSGGVSKDHRKTC